MRGQGTASTAPGCRRGAVAHTDIKGNLWLFGGVGRDSVPNQGNLNDVWIYDIITKTWTWTHGSSTINQRG